MDKITKKEVGVIINIFDNKINGESSYGELIGEVNGSVIPLLRDGDVAGASKSYKENVNDKIIPFVNAAFKKAQAELNLDRPLDIITEEKLENTLFMSKPVETKTVNFDEYKEENKEESNEDKLGKSFILDLDFSKIDNEDTTVKENTSNIFNFPSMPSYDEDETLSINSESSNIVDFPKVQEDVNEENVDANEFDDEEQNTKKTGKVLSIGSRNKNKKAKGKKDNAAYVDTVILCLVAQLAIFGILILVLLMIK